MTSQKENMINFFNLFKQREHGFSLVELAVSTIIIGVLSASIAYPYSLWIKKEKYDLTVSNLERMAIVVAAFRSSNGRYPCPAPLDVPRSDPSYGFETDCNYEAEVAVGTCANGVCAALSNRTLNTAAPYDVDINSDGSIDAWEQNHTPRIRIGAIPFRTLNISERMALDGYDGKYTYAVTEIQARNYPYNPEAGGISVEYEDAGGVRQSRIDPADSVDFVVYSHGQDRIGSYTIDGASYGLACNEATADGENCDHINGNPDAEFFVAQRTAEASGQQNDDMLLYQIPLNAPKWARSPDNGNDIFAIRALGTDGKIGGDWTYNWTPLPDTHPARMWIGGNVLVEGDSFAREFCDDDPASCFPARMIAGEGVECASGLMVGVANADAVCNDTTITMKCPDGEFIKTLSNGSLSCSLRPCLATTLTSC